MSMIASVPSSSKSLKHGICPATILQKMQLASVFIYVSSRNPSAGPIKLMLLRRHAAIPELSYGSVRHQHWQRHAAQQRARRTAEQQLARAGMAVGTHYQ